MDCSLLPPSLLPAPVRLHTLLCVSAVVLHTIGYGIGMTFVDDDKRLYVAKETLDLTNENLQSVFGPNTLIWDKNHVGAWAAHEVNLTGQNLVYYQPDALGKYQRQNLQKLDIMLVDAPDVTLCSRLPRLVLAAASPHLEPGPLRPSHRGALHISLRVGVPKDCGQHVSPAAAECDINRLVGGGAAPQHRNAQRGSDEQQRRASWAGNPVR